MAEALQQLQAEPADVALVELNLSDEQGLGTLYALLKDHPTLPIVVLTTIEVEDLAITAIQERAQDYLIKDAVNYAAVSRSIRYAIERKRIECELNSARQTAQAASAAKSEFLAHMSHELRSPLATILGYADNLLEPQLTRMEIQSAVETIRRNGLHLMEIVNDILDISKVETPRFEVERIVCSPAQIVADVAAMLDVRARAKGLELAVDWAARRAGDDPQRSRPPQADSRQPGQQRDQVHEAGTGADRRAIGRRRAGRPCYEAGNSKFVIRGWESRQTNNGRCSRRIGRPKPGPRGSSAAPGSACPSAGSLRGDSGAISRWRASTALGPALPSRSRQDRSMACRGRRRILRTARRRARRGSPRRVGAAGRSSCWPKMAPTIND